MFNAAAPGHEAGAGRKARVPCWFPFSVPWWRRNFVQKPGGRTPAARVTSYNFPTSHHATRKTQTLAAMPSNTVSTAALLIPPTRRHCY